MGRQGLLVFEPLPTCSERGPDTLRVFSNCELIRVIIPRHEMYESLDKTCSHEAGDGS